MADTQKSSPYQTGQDHTPALNNLLQQPPNGFNRGPYPGQPWTAGHRPNYPPHPGMPYPHQQMMGHMFNQQRGPMPYNHGEPHHGQMQARQPHPGYPSQPVIHQQPGGGESQQPQPQGAPPQPVQRQSPMATPQMHQAQKPTTQSSHHMVGLPQPDGHPMIPGMGLKPGLPSQHHPQPPPGTPPAGIQVPPQSTTPISNGHPPQAISPATHTGPPMNRPPSQETPKPNAPFGQPMPYPHGHPAYRNGYPPRQYAPRPGYPPHGYPPGYTQMHPGAAFPGQFRPGYGHPAQQNPSVSQTDPAVQAAAQAAAQAAVREAQAQGMNPSPFYRGSMFGPPRPGFPSNGFPNGPPGPRPMVTGASPRQPMSSPLQHRGQIAPAKSDPVKDNGPMSPASSIGDDSVNIVNSPRPNRPTSAASSQGSEVAPTPRKSNAKAAVKLAVLYQPESLERRKFIDEVIRFHEDKGQPLKAPPMFNQAPLDIFELYNLVKKRQGMNEVTKKKEWVDVVRGLNFQVTPSAGFTLKKQYVKYLFEIECRLEQRQIDPEEIRKIVEQSTRKRDKRRSKAKPDEGLDRNTASPGSNPGMTPPPPSNHQVMSAGPPTSQGPFPPQGFPYPRPPVFNGQPGQFPPVWGGPPGYSPSSNGSPMGPRPQLPFHPGMVRPGYGPGMMPRPGMIGPGFISGYRPMPPSGPQVPMNRPNPNLMRYQRPTVPPQQQQPQQLQHHRQQPTQARPGTRRKLNLPPGCVETTEPTPFYRITASRSQMEVDFWKHIIMPLRSGLPAETSSALNLLLVLSRDDCTLPQLRLQSLQGLLSLLTSHLRVVLNVIFPEKANQAGIKRRRPKLNHKPLSIDEENLYKVNFKEVQQSKLGSKYSKKQVRVKKKKFGRHLLPNSSEHSLVDHNDDEDRVIILPSDSERVADYKPSWVSPLYTVKKTSEHMFQLAPGKRMSISQDQEDDLKKLNMEWGTEAASLKRRKISLSMETLSAVDDDDIESDFFEIEEDPVLNISQRPIMLTARLNCLFAIFRNLSFLPANWKILATDQGLMALMSSFLERERSFRGRCPRHADFALPQKFFWDESVLKPTPPPHESDGVNSEVKIKKESTELSEVKPKIDPEPLAWLKESDPYWSRFFGDFTLIESNYITHSEVSWKKEVLEELTDDAMVFISNVALEVELCELERPEPIIQSFLNCAAYRAMDNEVPVTNEFNVEPVSVYRLALETLVRIGLNEDNIGMILSTKPFGRIERAVQLMFENINQDYSLTLKEMSVALLHKFLVPESEVTTSSIKLPNAISSLVAFIDTLSPDVSTHSRGMATEILAEMSKDVSSHALLLHHESKLAELFANSVMLPTIHNRLADILFRLSHKST